MNTTTASWIQKTPGVIGGDACIRGTRVAVWMIVIWKRYGATDEWILRNFPDLTRDDLDAADAYYTAHRHEIDTAIRENDEA